MTTTPVTGYKLPEGVTKEKAIETGVAIIRLMGGNWTDAEAYRRIANPIPRRDWYSDTKPLLNARFQSDLAREIGVSERQYRNIEARLEAWGLIDRATAPNGYRGHAPGQKRGDPPEFGLSIEPTIANFQAFAKLIQEAQLQNDIMGHH